MPFEPSTPSKYFARLLLVPSMVDVFFCALLLAAFARPAGLQVLLGDGDTGWHIRTGELVLATGHVPVVDPFSFTRAGQPWFAWEWLSDVLFALLWRWKGLSAVAAFCGVVMALGAAILFARLLDRGVGLAVALAASMAAVAASSVHYLARPHVFSILFYSSALWVVERDRARPGRAVWLLIPFTALWANLHAGFLAWGVTLAVLVGVAAAERQWGRTRRYGLLAMGCAAASLINPYGWKLHTHVIEYLNSKWIMDHVQEFQSPSIRSEGMVIYALLLLAAVAMAWRAPVFERVLVLLWAFASMRSARHVPLFALVAAPVVAGACAEFWRSAAARSGGRSAVTLLRDFSLDWGRGPRASLWLAVVAVMVIALIPAVGFPDGRFPVQAVERNLARLSGGPRVLTSDQWADYLIFRLYPRQRVFFDGRSDFFGPGVGGDYRKLFAAEDGWRELLDRYGFELALLPHDWPLSTMLEREPGWRHVYGDGVAVLYARSERPRSGELTGDKERSPVPFQRRAQ
ncbi:MAG: hypothetical protein JWP63_6932 [Candidatus Solibacter sp.]|nr:hypothetical protein [Candidatus Solibacter sp.]